MKKYFFAFILLIVSVIFPQNETKYGTLSGTLIDKDNKQPLIGANLILENTNKGTTTDIKGQFIFNNLPVGTYSVKISYIGYFTLTKTDVIVRSNRNTELIVELIPTPYQTEEVNVTAGYFSEVKMEPVNSVNFSYEEIRRAPGSAGDVSRIMMSLPSVAKVNDQSNSLIVRGGSPLENAFYIDNIEIPNINHFPTQGSSGGPIGVLNVDFISDVNFYSGGFSTKYGDKLSSIMDISFREGSHENFEGQLDLNYIGFGGVFEGPIGNNGSFMISARKSYLDLIVKSFDIGTTVAPNYSDYQWKVNYNLSSSNKLSLLGIWSVDQNNPDNKTAIENDMLFFGNQDILIHTNGVNWQKIWGKAGYSNTSVSFTSNNFDETYYETGSQLLIRKNDSYENELKIRNINYVKFNSNFSSVFGLEYKLLKSNYNNYFGEFTDAIGNYTPAFEQIYKFSSYKVGIFTDYTLDIFKIFTLSLGVRGDYFNFNDNLNISPRFALTYHIDELSSIKLFAGLFYQNLPTVLLSQNYTTKKLKDPKAEQVIIGYERLLTKDIRLTLDFYYKQYSQLPIDPTQPELFLIDELYYRSGFFFNHEDIVSTGKAYTKGVELVIQKKLADQFYGLASVSYSIAKHKANDNIWRNRVYDNRIVTSIEGGYKPNNKWEFSFRWIYAGGTPYTPFNLTESNNLNRAVLDQSRINSERYPAYHSLNIRVDKRFYFEKTNLVVYLSIWNTYNRKNIASYYWDTQNKTVKETYQWNLMPIFGLEFEF